MRKAFVTVERISDPSKCDGCGDLGLDAKWEIYTPVDTGDGYRVACNDCLGDWVDCVLLRIEDNDGNIASIFEDDVDG